MNAIRVIGLVGYGEVGKILAEDLRAYRRDVDGMSEQLRVLAYDLKLDRADSPAAQDMRAHAALHGVELLRDHASIARESDLVISAVTASQAVRVARAVAAGVQDGGLVLDVNSASPGAKVEAARAVDSAGGRYVEGAVMTSVPPYRIKVPLLLGGPHAQAAQPLLESVGFRPQVSSERLGVASATKMARSVMIKGLEAMVIESFTTARAYGVEDRLIESLRETFPGVDWEKQADYFFQRAILHGRRRAEEVREVAVTVRDAGLTPWSSTGTALRQDWIADLADDATFGPRADIGATSWRTNADKVLAAQPMTPGWLRFHPSPSVPGFTVPKGAVDAHCHVFGPAREFPYAPQRKYTPCDAGKEQLFALRDRLGFERNVIVQATCHGTDNRALVDALRSSEGRARGVATVGPEITDEALAELHRAGVRGVRFNFVRRLADFTPREVLTEIAQRISVLGWHVVVYFEAADLGDLESFFTTLPTAVVVDHMGRPDVTKPVDGPEFARFVAMMDSHPHIWSKVSCPERLSVAGPPALDGCRSAYRDVVPFARLLVERFPDRVLWGTDWPHPNLKDHMPDDGLLVDHIPHIAPTEDLQRRLLVDNPNHLYWND